jgi:metalloendopeptidase OMA1, mitochondrial
MKTWTRFAFGLVVATAVGCGDFGTQDRPGSDSEEGPGGRVQVRGLNPRQELALGRQAYQQVLESYEGYFLPENNPQTNRVRQVATRIARASEIEPLQREILLHIRGYQFEWDARVIRDEQVNAFCLPAGKIFVFTGLLKFVENDDGELAAVMAHEVAHALAHHTSERIGRERSSGNVLTKLSFSRMQESEADHIGVFLMAFAGYDPEKAAEFWDRMRRLAAQRGEPPEILSDHPSDERRFHDLRQWAPQAAAAKKAYDDGRIAPAGR